MSGPCQGHYSSNISFDTGTWPQRMPQAVGDNERKLAAEVRRGDAQVQEVGNFAQAPPEARRTQTFPTPVQNCSISCLPLVRDFSEKQLTQLAKPSTHPSRNLTHASAGIRLLHPGLPHVSFFRKPAPPSLLADWGCPQTGSSPPFPQQQLHQNGSQSGSTKSLRGFQGSRIRPTLFRAEYEVSFISGSVFSQG